MSPDALDLDGRLRRTNTVAASAFVVGGSLFALGAALAQAGVATTTCASVYLVGGVFFSAGGYTSVLQVVRAATAGTPLRELMSHASFARLATK